MTTQYAVGFDSETYRIVRGRKAPKLVCGSFYDDRTASSNLLMREHYLDQLERYLRDPQALLVGHNLAYDLAVAAEARPDLMPLIFAKLDDDGCYDTLVAELLINIRFGTFDFDHRTGKKPTYSLDALAQKHLGESIEGKHGPDSWRLEYHRLDGVPIDEYPPDAANYARLDAVYPVRVRAAQVAAYQSPDLFNQVRAAFALHLSACWGIRTDGQMVEALEARLREAVDEANKRLMAVGFVRPDGSRDMKAIQARVSQAYGGRPPLTNTGKPKTDAETLNESGDEDLEALAEIAADNKELSAFVPLLYGGVRYPITSEPNVLVGTGRTSWRKPNLQQQPRRSGVRECYVPRPGHYFCSVDYSIAELRALAQILLNLFGWSRMAEAFQAGRELHLETASDLLGMSYEQALAQKKLASVKDARQIAKAENFGFPGGLGAKTFVAFAKANYNIRLAPTMDESIERAKTLKRMWLTRYPEMNDYFKWVSTRMEMGGGRCEYEHPGSKRIRAGLGFCDGCNTPFQGLVADAAKPAFYAISRECYTGVMPNGKRSPLAGSRPVIFIHDETFAEVPIPQAHEAAYRISEIMIEHMERLTPDIPVLAEPALMERWYKDAEAVFDANGQLIPWRPKEEQKEAA